MTQCSKSSPDNMDRADILAAACVDAWHLFEAALNANKRKYPLDEFKKMLATFEEYIEDRHNSSYIHREIASFVTCIHEYVSCERKRVPNFVNMHTQRMSHMLFDDYDPIDEYEAIQD